MYVNTCSSLFMTWETQTNCVRAGEGICIGNLQFDQQFSLLLVLDNDAH